MQKLDLQEIRRRQIKILLSVHDCCEKNNLRYYLCGGTLLGAVRHEGYIPWDDDIDICLPRPDYEKLLKLYSSEQYEILTWKPDNEYVGLYTKISDTETLLLENGDFGEKSGIYIDVFPVDGLPSSGKGIKAHVKWMKFLQGLIVSTAMTDISHRPLHRRIEIRIMRLFLIFARDKHKIAHFIIEQAKRYNFDKSEKVGVVVWGYGAKEVIYKRVATEYVPGNFEGYHFMILKDYDAYLSSLYGDYMKLPPKEKRVSKHNPEVYLLEEKERQNG